jgi:hypothetical protein
MPVQIRDDNLHCDVNKHPHCHAVRPFPRYRASVRRIPGYQDTRQRIPETGAIREATALLIDSDLVQTVRSRRRDRLT